MAKPAAALTLPVIAPTVEAWRAMSLAEREELLIQINDIFSERRAAMVRRLQTTADELSVEAEQATARAKQALAVARAGIFALLEVRGVPCPEDVCEQVSTCDDPATLQRWLAQATSVRTAEEMLAAP